MNNTNVITEIEKRIAIARHEIAARKRLELFGDVRSSQGEKYAYEQTLAIIRTALQEMEADIENLKKETVDDGTLYYKVHSSATLDEVKSILRAKFGENKEKGSNVQSI